MARRGNLIGFLQYWLLLLLVICSVRRRMVVVADFDCEASFLGGGCPDEKACAETCSHCYKNWGTVVSFCLKDLEIYWRCVCGFKDGAPCPPFDGCRPPKPPAAMANAHVVYGTLS